MYQSLQVPVHNNSINCFIPYRQCCGAGPILTGSRLQHRITQFLEHQFRLKMPVLKTKVNKFCFLKSTYFFLSICVYKMQFLKLKSIINVF